MSHHHHHEEGHSHSHGHHQHGSSNIKVAFFLNFGFSIIEIAGGLFTNSIAIISDALHDLGDSFSLALAWYFQKLSTKQSNPKFTYGYKRFSLLGALINSIVLLVGSGFVIYAAIGRLIEPQEANAKGMLLLAVLGIVFNGLAILKLKKGHSLNERAVALHLLEDVLGWIAVLVAGVVMLFADVPILDPLLSLLIACYILFNIYRNLKDTLKVILQGTPENIDRKSVEELILSVGSVRSVHDLHLWTMDGEYNIMTAHVVVGQDADIPCLKQQLKEKLKTAGIHHPTIEVEKEDEDCEFEKRCC
ncbi:MAG TPA: cation diffusion facilitator family transporter [Dysgonamonadaceae bacterium]|nr:cation diffusion facilitator family transporter [Dysgonamonadaceae bacterium]